MPIYEYKCQDCNTKFEKLVRRAAESVDVNCPSCGQKRVSQEYSTFSAHANGAGESRQETPVCGRGMCGSPGMCGMN
jgi:putative FmdB family regulatory protein